MKKIHGMMKQVCITVCTGLCLWWPEAGAAFSYGERSGSDESCLACHGDAGAVPRGRYIDRSQYGQTNHARIGCDTCHGTVPPGHPDGEMVPKAKCLECHADVDREYARGLHAVKAGCTGCHNPHMVQSPREVSGEEVNRVCSGCHETLEMTARHGEWLPQSELHLNMLPCITCHTSARDYFVIMYVVRSGDGSRFGRQLVASYAELKRFSGNSPVTSLVDRNADNYVSLEELRIFNRNQKEFRLRGMLTPATVSHKFEILDNRRNCTFCHTSGPGLMQASLMALPQKDGSYAHVPVETGAVLDALYATPDFYAMGSTKNRTLNGIGLAVVCCGLIMPVGHGLVRFLTRKCRKGKEHQS